MDRGKFANTKVVAYYMGKVVIGVGLILLIPILTGIIFGEWVAVTDFFISFCIFMIVGSLMEIFGYKHIEKFSWMHGLVISAGSWIVLMVLSAIPYYMSGKFLSFLDAMFDIMSGYTTTGLGLITDLDHVSHTLNMWRHLVTFIGGQGMVVLALSFLITKGAGSFQMYVGEAKDEKLLPNVSDTAKAIWKISLVYLLVGTVALTAIGRLIGMSFSRSVLHGLWIFMAGWSTGGFTPQSQSILYYHSGMYETVAMIFFVIGSFNFALHHAVWTGNRKELYKNIEIISFVITLLVTTSLAINSFLQNGMYGRAINMFRKIFFQMISAHTTTGFMSVYGKQFLNDWGSIGIIAISIAMLIGGSASSTAGGFKGIRMGILWKALVGHMRKVMSPDRRVFIEKYHFVRKNVLSDDIIKTSMLIVLCYILTYTIGVIATLFAGYSLPEAIFESASVTGNVGLTIGVTSPSMPDALKWVYIIMMWVARLEFISVFALIGIFLAGVRNTWKRFSA